MTSLARKDVGRAPSTMNVDKRGLDCLNWWLVKERKTMPLEKLTMVYVEGENLLELIYDLSDFLQNTTIPKNFDSTPSPTENIQPVTLAKYLDGAIYYLEQKFPTHPFWKDTSILSGITGASFLTGCSRSQIHKPDSFGQDRKMPLYSFPREDMLQGGKSHWLYSCNLQEIATRLMLKSCLGTKKGNPLEQRFIAVASKSSAGRSGEIKYLKYNEFIMDIFLGMCDTHWTELKNLIKYSCPQPPGTHYSICFLHAWICFVSIEHGLYREKDQAEIAQFVCMSLHKMKDTSVASHITDIYRDNLPIPEDMKTNISSKSSRIACVTELAVHSGVTKEESHCRTGHSLGTNQQSYLDRMCPALTYPGGAALAGWKDTRTPQKYPSFEILGTLAKPSIEHFIQQLVPLISVPQFERHGALYPLLEAGAACMVMWHNTVTRDLGFSNAVSSKVRQAARDAKIFDPVMSSNDTDAVIADWSDRIKDHFHQMNPDYKPLGNDCNGPELAAALNLMVKHVTTTNLNMTKLMAANEDQTKTIAAQGAEITVLTKNVSMLREQLNQQSAFQSRMKNIFRTPPRELAQHSIAGTNVPNLAATSIAATSVAATSIASKSITDTNLTDTQVADASAAIDEAAASIDTTAAAAAAAPAASSDTHAFFLPSKAKKARLSYESRAEESSKPSNSGKIVTDLIFEAWKDGKLIADPLLFKHISMPLHLNDKGKWCALMELIDYVILEDQRKELEKDPKSDDSNEKTAKDTIGDIGKQCLKQMAKWDGKSGGRLGFSGLGKRVQDYKVKLDKNNIDQLQDMPSSSTEEDDEEDVSNVRTEHGTPEGNRSIASSLGFDGASQWIRQTMHGNNDIQRKSK